MAFTDGAGVHNRTNVITQQGNNFAYQNMSPTMIFNTIIRAF